MKKIIFSIIVAAIFLIPSSSFASSSKMWFGYCGAPTASATRWWCTSGDSNALNTSTRAQNGITLYDDYVVKNFCVVQANVTQPAGGTQTYTIYKNTVATAIQVTYTASSPAYSRYCDTTHSETFASGDTLSIEQKNNAGTSGAGSQMRWFDLEQINDTQTEVTFGDDTIQNFNWYFIVLIFLMCAAFMINLYKK